MNIPIMKLAKIGTILMVLFVISFWIKSVKVEAQSSPDCYISLYTTTYNGVNYYKNEPITIAQYNKLPNNVKPEFKGGYGAACGNILPSATPTPVITAPPTASPTPLASPTPSPHPTNSPTPVPTATPSPVYTGAVDALNLTSAYSCGTSAAPLSTGADFTHCISAIVRLSNGTFNGTFSGNVTAPTIFAEGINDPNNDIDIYGVVTPSAFTIQSYTVTGSINTTDTSLVTLLFLGNGNVNAPTPTPSPSPSPSPSPTPTASPSPSPTPIVTASPSPTASPTIVPTGPTASPSPTHSPSPSPSPTLTASPVPTASPSHSPTPVPTPSPTATGIFATTSFNGIRQAYLSNPSNITYSGEFYPLNELPGTGEATSLAPDYIFQTINNIFTPPNYESVGNIGAMGGQLIEGAPGPALNGNTAFTFNGTGGSVYMYNNKATTTQPGSNATSASPSPSAALPFWEEIWFKTTTCGSPIVSNEQNTTRSPITGEWFPIGEPYNHVAGASDIFFIDSSCNVGFSMSSSTTNTSYQQPIRSSGTNYGDGNWHELIAAYVPQTTGNPIFTLYADTTPVASATAIPAYPVTIGWNNNAGYGSVYPTGSQGITGITNDYYTGSVADFLLVNNSTVNTSQIQQLYQSASRDSISDAIPTSPTVKSAVRFISAYGYDAGGIQASPGPNAVFPNAITASTSVQTVPISNLTHFSSGSYDIVDDGVNREMVQLNPVSTASPYTVSGIFTVNHAANTNVYNNSYSGQVQFNEQQTLQALETTFVPWENAGLRAGYSGGSNLVPSSGEPAFTELCAHGIGHVIQFGGSLGVFTPVVPASTQTQWDQQVEYNGGPACLNYIDGPNELDDDDDQGTAPQWVLSYYNEVGLGRIAIDYYNNNVLPSGHPTAHPLIWRGPSLGHPDRSAPQLVAFMASLGNATTTSAITANASTAQAVTLSNVTGTYQVGQVVQVVDGSNSEYAILTTVGTNTVSAIFLNNHNSGLPVVSPAISQLIDDANIHYSSGGAYNSDAAPEEPESSYVLNSWRNYGLSFAPGKGTEDGEFGFPDSTSTVPLPSSTPTLTPLTTEAITTKHILRYWGTNFNAGVDHMFEDNLNDYYQSNFGYEGAGVDEYGNMKPPMWAARTVMQNLADPNPTPVATFVPTQYTYSLSNSSVGAGNNNTADIRTIPLQKSDGSDWIVIWAADQLWNVYNPTNQSTPLPVYPQTIKVNLPAGTTWAQFGVFGTSYAHDNTCTNNVKQGYISLLQNPQCLAELNADHANYNWTSLPLNGTTVNLLVPDELSLLRFGTGAAPSLPTPIPSPSFTAVPTPLNLIAPPLLTITPTPVAGTTAAPTATPTTPSTYNPTPTPSPTPTATASPSPTPTASPSPTPTLSPTPSPSPTPTASPSPSPTASPSPSPTVSPTPIATASPSPSPTVSPTVSPSTSPSAQITPAYVNATPYGNYAAANTSANPFAFSFLSGNNISVVASFKCNANTNGGTIVSLTGAWSLEGGTCDSTPNSASPVGAGFTDVGNAITAAPANSLSANATYLIVGTQDGASLNYYVCTSTCTQTTVADAHNLTSGTSGSIGGPTRIQSGDIWNVQVYNKALNLTQVQALASAAPTDPYSPTPVPTTSVAGLAPGAYSGYVQTAMTFPSALPSVWQQELIGAVQIYPNASPNPSPSPLTVTVSGAGPDMECHLYPRVDGGVTGYAFLCINKSTTTAEGAVFKVSRAIRFDSLETSVDTNDSTSLCPGFATPLYTDNSYHECSLGYSLSANGTLNFNSGYFLQQPGSVRIYNLINWGIVSATPTPEPSGATPTPTPSPVPPVYPSDFPSPYQSAVVSALAPAMFTTPYPFTQAPKFTIGQQASCFESMTLPRTDGSLLFVPYCNVASPSASTFEITVSNTINGAFLQSDIVVKPGPTTSPCPYGQGLNFINGASAYGMCLPGNSAAIMPFIAGYPTANPSPTYGTNPYPGATDAACGTNYMSKPGGPFPPMSRQCMFLRNPMVGIIPANPVPDPNSSAYIHNSGISAGPATINAGGTIQASGSGEGNYNWVTNGSPSVPLNQACQGASSGQCGTLSNSLIWTPQDVQVQGPGDCHMELVYYSLGYVDDFWETNKPSQICNPFSIYPGNSIITQAGTRVPFNGDGTHSTVDASTISPGIGMIRGQDVLDTRVSTFSTGIQIAPECTSNSFRYPSHATDGGVGATPQPDGTCDHTLAIIPNGAEIYLNETAAHVLSCNLDILSQKYWMNMVPGIGHGLFVTDTNGGKTGKPYYVQIENDRDMTRFGIASSWAVVAKMLGVSLSSGIYPLNISTGTNNCINSADIQVLDVSTPNQPGSTIAP